MTVRVIDTAHDAEQLYRTFNDRSHRRHTKVDFGWPKRMQEVGSGRAVMYRSNKWKKNLDQYEDYKHIAEAPQAVYVTPGFLREWANPRKPIKVEGPYVTLQEPMPKHFAVLAPLLGAQIQLTGHPKDDSLYEVVIAHAMLGGAHHPDTEEPFIFVYTKSGGVHMIFTGAELDVEKDGIVG